MDEAKPAVLSYADPSTTPPRWRRWAWVAGRWLMVAGWLTWAGMTLAIAVGFLYRPLPDDADGTQSAADVVVAVATGMFLALPMSSPVFALALLCYRLGRRAPTSTATDPKSEKGATDAHG